jgi:hypothetical protein
LNDRRGLVVKRTRSRVTAITKNGEFVTWKDRRELMPGEVVLLPSPRFQGFLWQRLVPATALAAVLIFLSFFGYRHYLYARPVLAYVTFDSSGEAAGSIELEVNDRGLVKKAVALDEAGAQALSGLRVEMRSVQTVLAELRQAMPNRGKIVVALIPVTGPEDNSPPKQGATGSKREQSSIIAELAKKVFDSVGEATAVVLDMETRAVANELGLSAGRAASWALWDLESAEDPGTGYVTEPGQSEPGEYTEPFGAEPFGTEPFDPEPLAEPRYVQEPGSREDPAGSEPGHGGDEDPVQAGEPLETTVPLEPLEPGKPGEPGKPDGPGKPQNHIPPGQQKKADAASYLAMIRKDLPELDWGKDSKKSAKELEKLTKEWLKTLKEMSKKDSHSDRDAEREEDDRGGDRSVSPKGGDSGKPDNVPSGDKSGDKPGKSGSEGKDKGNPQSGKGDKDNKNDKNDKNDKDHLPGSPSNKNLPGRGKDAEPGEKGFKGKTDDDWEPASSGEHTGSGYADDKGKSLTDRFTWTRELLRRLWR